MAGLQLEMSFSDMKVMAVCYTAKPPFERTWYLIGRLSGCSYLCSFVSLGHIS